MEHLRLECRTWKESDGIVDPGTAGRDDEELSDGGCEIRVEDPADDAVETTSHLYAAVSSN